ncbi:MAG: ACP S-malonyltransferase [Acidimicrobiia bacterium]
MGGDERAVAVVFPGQGAQAPGLGVPWRDRPEWAVVERAQDLVEADLSALLLEASADDLRRTDAAQLAVLMASLIAWESVRAELEPLAATYAGHSLGQITALIAAGAVGFEDGLRLAAARAKATQACADAGDHAMAAFLGASPEIAESACTGEAWVANDNGGGQVAVAGRAADVTKSSDRARELGVKRVIPLAVGGAFHTPLMAPAAEELRPLLATTSFQSIAVPVVCNTDAEPVTDPAEWPGRLESHLIQRVRWRDVMHAVARHGARRVVEVGPGATLTGLFKRERPDLTLDNVFDPTGRSTA